MASWIQTPVRGDLPLQREYHAATALAEERMIIFGGCQSEKEKVYLNDVWMFETSTSKWKMLNTVGAVPCGRAKHSITCIPGENKLVLFGGFDGTKFYNDLHILDVVSLTWSKVDIKGDLPQERAGHGMATFTGVLGSSLVLFGGKDAVNYYNDLFILDLKSSKWIKARTSGDIPSPRAFHSATSIGKTLYIFGGEVWYPSLGAGDTFNDLYVLNSVTMRWTKPPLHPASVVPGPRFAHSATVFDRFIVIFGGSSRQNIQDELTTNNDSSLFMFDTVENRWGKHQMVSAISGKAPYACHGHTTVLLQHSKIFVFGGQMTEILYSEKGIEMKKKTTNDMRIFYHLEKIIAMSMGQAPPEPLKRTGSFFRSKSPNLRSPKEKIPKKEKRKTRGLKMGNDLLIGSPYGLEHKAHVDFDMNWSNPDVFQQLEKLGQGAYGAVFKAKHKGSGFLLAIKEIKIVEGKFTEELKNEIDILKKCRHKSIVSYFGSCMHKTKIWILMDYCHLGSIRDLLETSNRTLTESEIVYVIAHTLEGLAYLHAKNILHRDVKAANILLTSEAEIKIADFGISDSVGKTSDSIGTPLWMAPEVINRAEYNNRCDVWSLGITIIELADGFPPYHNIKLKRAMMMVPIKPAPTVSEPSKWTTEFNEFLARCLIKDPEKRPTALELMNHKFVQKVGGPEVLQERIAEVIHIREKRASYKSTHAFGSSESEDKSSGGSDSPGPTKNLSGNLSDKEGVDSREIFATSVTHQTGSLNASSYSEGMSTSVYKTARENPEETGGSDSGAFNTSVVYDSMKSSALRTGSSSSSSIDLALLQQLFDVSVKSALDQSNQGLRNWLGDFKQELLAQLSPTKAQDDSKEGALRAFILSNLNNMNHKQLEDIVAVMKAKS